MAMVKLLNIWEGTGFEIRIVGIDGARFTCKRSRHCSRNILAKTSCMINSRSLGKSTLCAFPGNISCKIYMDR